MCKIIVHYGKQFDFEKTMTGKSNKISFFREPVAGGNRC